MPSFVWGIDPALDHVAFAFAEVDAYRGLTTGLLSYKTRSREGDRLHGLYNAVLAFSREMASRFPADCVWIEQPSGRFIKPQSYYAVGVMQVAVAKATGASVWTIAPSDWKARIGIGGGAGKSQIASWAQAYGVDHRITRNKNNVYQAGSFDEATQDEMDACGIAVAGRSIYEKGAM